MKYLSFLILILVFVNCGGTKSFQTKLTYRAPLSTLQIEIESSGIVKSGADISDNSESHVKISSIRQNLPPLILDLKLLPQGEEITVNGNRQNSELEPAISQNLQTLGYPTPNADELKEIVLVIYGSSAGPKGIRLKGQTKFLEVVNTDYKYK